MTSLSALLLMATSAMAANEPLALPAAWEYTAPLVRPEPRELLPSHAQKDPTVVFHEGRWHLFMTIKCADRTITEYSSFARWEDADQAPRTVLTVCDSKYFCAPQVFFYRPHGLWYLIYQMGVPGAKKMWVAYSTTKDIADPQSWTKAAPALDGGPADPRIEGGLDYWMIADSQKMYLFYTTDNGKMWRLSTPLDQFPRGWGDLKLALWGDIFEASHTYRLAGREQWLTIIEANPGGRRYYKAYVADRLDGDWTPVADSEAKPLAGARNARPAAGVTAWTDNISHAELLRAGNDETLTVDPSDWRLLFQGATQAEKAGVGYGAIPWRLGILTPVAR